MPSGCLAPIADVTTGCSSPATRCGRHRVALRVDDRVRVHREEALHVLGARDVEPHDATDERVAGWWDAAVVGPCDDTRLDGSRAHPGCTIEPLDGCELLVLPDSTSCPSDPPTAGVPDVVAGQIAVEQAHVDRVMAELEKAGRRADVVQAEGLARGQFGHTVEVGDAEGASLFERDALMYHAAKRRNMLDTEHEGSSSARLDIDHGMLRQAGNEGYLTS